MIDSLTDFNEDLERTQPLPLLTADVQLDEAIQRERAARTEIVELMRQNLRQARQIEQLRARQDVEQRLTTEERLFEVCGALKDTLSNVLRECRTRGLVLSCGRDAHRALENSCCELEQILSAPGFSASPEFAFRSIPAPPRPVRVPRLELLRSEELSDHGA